MTTTRRPDLRRNGRVCGAATPTVTFCKFHGSRTGVPVLSPHDLRHLRISLLHHQGRSWAEIARFVGQRTLSLTADNFTDVLSDGRELDYGGVLR